MLNAHIVESCSKFANPSPTMPKDIKNFFGYKKALSVSRWSNSEDLDPTIREDDVVTGTNILPWLNRQR